MKVVKFGGSSLASAEQFKKVGAIIRADESRRYVIPSAPGKRHDGDTKVTDLLYKMADLAREKQDFSEVLQQIRERFEEIIEGLGMQDFSLEDQFAEIEKQMRAAAAELNFEMAAGLRDRMMELRKALN